METGERALRDRIETEIQRYSGSLSSVQPGGPHWQRAVMIIAVLSDIRGHRTGDCRATPGAPCSGDRGKACRGCGQVVRART